MKFLGLDIGERRIGIAFGDSALLLATPVDVLERGTFEQDVRVLAEFVRRFEVARCVVGLPRNMDGTQGAQAEAVIAYAVQVVGALDRPIIFWDERLTTEEASQRARAAELPSRRTRRGKKARHVLDAIAAAVILQDFLDSKGSEFP